MKKILFVIMLTISSMLSFAGVIMTTNGERIEDITIESETNESIVYIENGIEKTISIVYVQAVLFDNGNFKEYPKYTSSVVANESTVTENKNIGYNTQRQSVQPIGWNSFDPNGEKLWLSGWCTAGSGLGVMIVGLICIGVGDGPMDGLGLTFITLGSVSTAASIPLLTIGGMRKFKKNDKSAETAQSYILELQAQKNQIGLALKF